MQGSEVSEALWHEALAARQGSSTGTAANPRRSLLWNRNVRIDRALSRVISKEIRERLLISLSGETPELSLQMRRQLDQLRELDEDESPSIVPSMRWLRVRLGNLDQWITLVGRPRHFGSQQWYFICPAMNRPASVLWKPAGATRFCSRQTWGRQVAYQSQFNDPTNRAHAGIARIKSRLIADLDPDEWDLLDFVYVAADDVYLGPAGEQRAANLSLHQ
jgi:hypothetical protein